MEGTPQREELMAWFLEHKDELIPTLGVDAFMPSGGTEGQHLVKSADGFTWEDPPEIPEATAVTVGLPTSRSITLDSYYTPNATKPVFVSMVARLYIPSAYTGDPGLALKTSDPNNRVATEITLGVNRFQHTAGDPDDLNDQQLHGVIPAGWEYRVQKIGQFTGANAPSMSVLSPGAFEQILG